MEQGSSNGVDGVPNDHANLSTRGRRAVQPALPYFQAFMELQQKGLWSPSNPDGSIILTVAENKLATGMLHERLQRVAARGFPLQAFFYDNMKGTDALREAMAGLLREHIMPGAKVDPQHICVSSGCGAILDQLFHCICDAGDAVLIPAPYYPAFDNDLVVRNGVAPCPVHLDPSQDLGPQLEAAADQAAAQGHCVRALLISHPSNPLGIMYSDQQLADMLAFCLRRGVHCVSDEIYACSIFGDGARFNSMQCVADARAAGMEAGQHADDLVHIVFGMSKDFAASGMRLGCLFTRSAPLHQALNNLSYFAGVSGLTQHVWQQVLSDADFVRSYLQENQRLLRHSYDLLSAALDEAKIPYQPANSAMFIWVDLRAWLSDSSWEAEDALWRRMTYEHLLLLTPGKACHAPEPGFFRICWAWMPADSLPVAVQRMLAAKPQ